MPAKLTREEELEKRLHVERASQLPRNDNVYLGVVCEGTWASMGMLAEEIQDIAERLNGKVIYIQRSSGRLWVTLYRPSLGGRK